MNWKNNVNFVSSRLKMRRVFGLILIISLVGCSNYNKILKGKNRYQKFEAAMKYYGKNDYGRALPLFEQLRDYYLGKDSMEIIYYHTAYCYYGIADYSYAAHVFHDFADNFKRSKKITEMEYMAIYCNVLMVGSHELDQSETKRIIGQLQDFINAHPENSYYVAQCTDHIQKLHRKLELKEYEHVIQFYNMGDYKAALTLAKIVIKDFPDIAEKEYLEYLIIKSYYLYGKNSIENKKEERFKLGLEAVTDYFKSNPNASKAKYFQDVSDLQKKINNQIQILKDNKI